MMIRTFTLLFAVLWSSLAQAQVTVQIDVKPGNALNVVNYKSQGKVPVALLCNAVSNPANIR